MIGEWIVFALAVMTAAYIALSATHPKGGKR